jgi:hypothetical protein
LPARWKKIDAEAACPVGRQTQNDSRAFCRHNSHDPESGWYERALAALAGGKE